MAKVVICPACQSKGSIPDGAGPARIRCPKCGQTFDVKSAAQSSPSTTGTGKRPSAGPKPPAAAPAAYSDLEDVQPLAPVSGSGFRRAPGAAGPAGAPGSGQSSVLLAVLGIGGLAVVLLVAILVVVWSQGGGGKPAQTVAQANAPAPPEPVVQPAAALPAATAPAAAPAAAPTSYADSSGSQAIDSAEVVRRLKDATVYLKNKVAGKTLASGTGFVIEARGDTVIVATNRHVAVLDISEIPSRFLPQGSTLEIEAVFRSGQGPQLEQALPAQIIAADTSEEFATDLAILVVQGVRRPPTPINVQIKSETTEGMAYTGAGFPLGGMLSKVNDNKGNPSVTITRGGIAALRRDEHGHIDLFQVDGSLQPGNSGGPIVEEKSGKLIGVAVAKVGAVDTIGFVVPAEQLRKTLAGRIGNLEMNLKALQDNNANLEVKAEIVDPKQKVQSVLVHVAPASVGKISPNSDGSWPPLPNTSPVELQRDAKTPSATGTVQVALAGEGAAKRKILIQTAHRDLGGKLVYSKPREVELPEKPGRVMVSTQIMRILKTLQRKTISMLGPLIDPEKDCKLVKDDDNMKINIEIPGGKVRSIAPYVVQRLHKNKPLHNAPMSLIDVDGDFAAIVEITGDIRAGDKLPKDRQGNDIPFTFQGAGLLLYQDKDNFVRLERTAGVGVQTLQPVHKVLFEVVKDGKQIENWTYPPVPEGAVSLLLMRRKGRVIVGASPTLGAPPMPFKGIEFDLPAKVKVGLTASNISAKQFIAHFENFALISSETQMELMFGDDVPGDKEDDHKKEKESTGS